MSPSDVSARSSGRARGICDAAERLGRAKFERDEDLPATDAQRGAAGRATNDREPAALELLEIERRADALKCAERDALADDRSDERQRFGVGRETMQEAWCPEPRDVDRAGVGDVEVRHHPS